MATDHDVRLCDTPTLREAVREADRLGLNRQLALPLLRELDPDGFHVLILVVMDHQAHPSRLLPPHHRLSVMLKIRDSMKPFVVFMDATHRWWKPLQTMADWRAEQDQAAMNVAATAAPHLTVVRDG